jgi:predicted TIM-barrel fold metal-dependent hydrolase
VKFGRFAPTTSLSGSAYKLSDPWTQRYLEKCQKLGVKNIHVHKGPTIHLLNRDAFDVADVDDAATSFPELNFIVDHVGLPRLDDFCWIAVQEPNVYGGLAAAIAFLHARPRYFAQIMSELLFWVGEDRLLFGSDFPVWHPQWIVEKFMAFELPEDLQKETGRNLTLEVKRENATNLRLVGGAREIRTPETLSDSMGGIRPDFGALFGPKRKRPC